MNIKMLIFSLMIYSSIVYSQQNIPSQPAGNTVVHVHVNTANKAGVTQQNQLEQQADHFSTQSTDVKTNLTSEKNDPSLQQQLYDFYQDQSKKIKETSIDTIRWIKDNKLKTASIAILSCYSYIAYQIYQANGIINDLNSWSNWHNSRSLNDLFATPQATLESDLLFAIQTRYVHPVNPTDFIYSIVQASNSLQKEMLILQEQIARYKWLQKSRCMALFFIDEQEIASLQEKHRKLSFLKHIFSSWCANYKIDKNS
jgi:hypothetical protein